MSEDENKAYNAGLDAQIDGAMRDANPHPPGTPLHEAWAEGWQQGADEDFEEDMDRD